MGREYYPEVSDLNEEAEGRLGLMVEYFTEMGRRDLVDETGLIGGIYVNTAREIDRMGLECENHPGCNMPIISLESRIRFALDVEERPFRMEDIRQEDEDVAEMLTETNLRVVYCMRHNGRILMPLEIQPEAIPARVIELPTVLTRFQHDLSLLKGGKLVIRSNGDRKDREDKKVVDLRDWKKRRGPKKP